MGEHYLKYKQRSLQKQLANTSYSSFRQVSQDIGNQMRPAQQVSMDVLKRQGVPLAQRMAVQQQTEQQFSAQMGQQFQNVRQQEFQRQSELSSQLDDTSAQLKEIKQQKEDAWKKTLYQGAGTAIGMGVGAVAGNPMLGAQIGSSVGTAAGGVATEDWDMALQGVGQTIAGISEVAALSSVRKEASMVGTKLSEIREGVASGKISPSEAAMMNQQINTILMGGGDITNQLEGFQIFAPEVNQ